MSMCSGRVDPGACGVLWQRPWSCEACHVDVFPVGDPGACGYFGNVCGHVRLSCRCVPVALIQGPAGTLATSFVM